MKIKKVISFFLIFLLVFSSIPIQNLYADTTYEDIRLRVTTDKDTIAKGQKGISFDASYIKMEYDSSRYYIPAGDSLNAIRIYANGKYDETDKFKIENTDGQLKLSIKYSPPSGDYTHPVQLRKHALYNIYIPQGTFKVKTGGSTVNRINYCFTTNTDEGTYKSDILKSITPLENAHGVDNYTNEIVLEFIDDIAADPDVLKNIGSYITLTTQPIASDMPSYNIPPSYASSDSIDNYTASINGNKLILKAKQNMLKDFALYTIKLKNNTVFLRNAIDVRISNRDENLNDYKTVQFYTDKMIAVTSPVNNQEGVSIEPTIKITFKYPVEMIDKTLITLTGDNSEGENVNISNCISLSSDAKTLIINVDDNEGNNIYPLRKNTLYKLNLGKGSVKFKNYWNNLESKAIANSSESIYFITSGSGEGPEATGYYSSPSSSKDIRYIDTTDLGSSGSIYVKFNKTVQWDKSYSAGVALSDITKVKLYKMPKACITKYDPAGMVYDANIIFDGKADKDNILPVLPDDTVVDAASVESPSSLDEIVIGKAEIVSGDMIKITPEYPLQGLTKYRLILEKSVLEDTSNCNMQQDLDFTFWAAASFTGTASWKNRNIINAQEIKENTSAPVKSYIVNGTPKYGTLNPIILNIDGDAIIKPDDTIITSILPQRTRINYNALKNISLTDELNSDAAASSVAIDRYELKYYYENGKKNTSIALYPSVELTSGKQYKLYIPQGVLKSRSGSELPTLGISFTVAGDAAQGKGIYGLSNNSIRTTDLKNAPAVVYVNGYNFNEKISGATLTGTSGNASGAVINIPAGYIRFISVTKLAIDIKDTIASQLAKESATGEYSLSISFSDGTSIVSPAKFTVLSKGGPKHLEVYPYGAGLKFDENSLLPQKINDVTRYFIQVTFDNSNNDLYLNGAQALANMKEDTNTILYAEGSSASVIDKELLGYAEDLSDAEQKIFIDKYIFIKDAAAKKAYLRIPVKILREQTTYYAVVGKGIVRNDVAGDGGSNSVINWSFSTMSLPTVDEVITGSVPENYNPDDPVIITGGNIYTNSFTISLMLGDQKIALPKNPVVKTDSEGKTYIELYLPADNKLKAGSYDVVLQNDVNHTRTLYSTISIVPSGGSMPSEEYVNKGGKKYGAVHADIKVSSDTLVLKEKYCDTNYLLLNLDEYMGEYVWTRKIKFEGDYSDSITKLETKSKWSDITIYGLCLTEKSRYDDDDDDDDDDDNYEDDAYVTLGRVEPELSRQLAAKIKNYNIKSDFIELKLDELQLSMVEMTIPFKNSNGKNIKVLTYDDISRKFSKVKNFTVDLPNKSVKISDVSAGIFVVVEE